MRIAFIGQKGIPARFGGVEAHVDKEVFLRNARLAVLPSELEGFPIFLLEAMARGLPCLASELSAPRASR